MSLKWSIFLPTGVTTELAGIKDPVEAYETLTRVAQTADELGYETLWLPDHFHPTPSSQAAVFESWTTAAAVARDTKRVRIGHLAAGNSYRNPALLAKMASTLDVLSHGRYTFGIGAGWYEQEYRAYGYEYPDAKTRLRQLGEAVQVILAMWKYAYACNVQGDFATIERKFAVLKQHCETIGRDYQSIHRTSITLCLMADSDEQARALLPKEALLGFPGDVLSYGLIGSPATIRQRLAAYEAAGVQELVIGFFDSPQLDTMRRFAREFIQ